MEAAKIIQAIAAAKIILINQTPLSEAAQKVLYEVSEDHFMLEDHENGAVGQSMHGGIGHSKNASC